MYVKRILNAHQQRIFRRWNNQGYAVFASIKSCVKIGTLLGIYLALANPSVAQVTEDEGSVYKSLDLSEIDVTGEELPEAYSTLSRVVVTVSKKEIEQAAVSSVNELLEYVTNIDIRQRGVNGVQADISVRGGTFDQVLILLNGVNITDPQTGHHNLNLPIDLSAIEKIEILKGPGAWRFGPGAFSGAINFITKTSDKNQATVALSGAQFGTYEGKASVGVKTGDISHFVSGNYGTSDGYTKNTDYKYSNLFYQGDLTTEVGSLSLQAGGTNKEFGANSFYTAKYPDQFERTGTYFASINYKLQLNKWNNEASTYYRRNNDNFVLFRDHPSWYSNFHTTDVRGINYVANYIHSENGVTTLGTNVRTESIWSNNLGEDAEESVTSPMADTIQLDKFHSRSNFSAFVGHKHYFNNLMVNVGVNLTRNTDQNLKWFVYPGVDFNYQLDEKNSISGSFNKTMRMPTYTDLYYKGPANIGNPDLEPEFSTGFELGYNYKSKKLIASIRGFYSINENLIDWVKDSVDGIWTTVNYSKVNTSGVELNVKANLDKIWEEQSILNTVTLKYTYLNQTKPETDLISYYSLNYLKHRFDLDLNHNIWQNIKMNWHLAYQDRNGQFEKIVDKASVGLVDYDPFVTLDCKIYWQQNSWKIYMMATNLLNVDYYDFGNVQQPGRWLKVGFSKQINFN